MANTIDLNIDDSAILQEFDDVVIVRILAKLNPTLCREDMPVRLIKLTGKRFNLGGELYEIGAEEQVIGYPRDLARAITAKKVVQAEVDNTEYVYMLDTVWETDGQRTIPVDSIVIDVKKLETGRKCTFLYNGERFYCHYPWALALNTPENRVLIEAHRTLLSTVQHYQNLAADAHAKIKTLGPISCSHAPQDVCEQDTMSL